MNKIVNNNSIDKCQLAKVKRVRKGKRRTLNSLKVELSLSHNEIHGLFNNSRQLAKLIRERDMSKNRKELFLQSLKGSEARVKMTYSELRLLAAFWVWADLNIREPDITELNLRIMKKLLGTNEFEKISQRVSDYERSKSLAEHEDNEDDFEFPEEDFDAWRER